ncbi:ADP-ribose pyrophosphatase [Deinococcus irradiatisoli]|uniref:ADP-ribose pyrophosphatase n=1 Tax=Deinococcus irradiatisoli TaxID=2202254 RepID=A0A2Z3JD19_9DEIO|nr:NUDIX hydrolase [Deinococcus irradiatisoli]AWN22835.1 ADP-ribose pyrophosphatase [Deinococcus irradiatisoli]
MSDTRTLYSGHIVDLEVQDGKWEIVRHAPAVAVLLLNAAGEMLCVRQFRHAIAAHTIEVPAGLIDDGEAPEAAARRELQEEAGLDADMTLLTRFYSSPGFCDEELHVFRAVNPRESRLPMDDDEDIEVLWLQPQAVLAGLRDGSLKGSATTVTAALLALTGAPPAAGLGVRVDQQGGDQQGRH